MNNLTCVTDKILIEKIMNNDCSRCNNFAITIDNDKGMRQRHNKIYK